MLKLKRVYSDVSESDGKRILVDGLWPRGIKKENLKHDQWLKFLAPSKELRQWFDHDPSKWDTFKAEYWKALSAYQDTLKDIKKSSETGDVTLLYAAKDETYNHAVVIKDYINQM